MKTQNRPLFFFFLHSLTFSCGEGVKDHLLQICICKIQPDFKWGSVKFERESVLFQNDAQGSLRNVLAEGTIVGEKRHVDESKYDILKCLKLNMIITFKSANIKHTSGYILFWRRRPDVFIYPV